MQKDISAPGLLRYVLPASVGVAILTGAAIALINDLPAMLLSVSRLMFAWAEDGIFPSVVARVHPQRHTPYIALSVAGIMASIGVLGSHFAGDFFLGIDIMVTSMMVNFLLMCITLLTFPKVNPTLAQDISIIKSRSLQQWIGGLGNPVFGPFLGHTHLQRPDFSCGGMVFPFYAGVVDRHESGQCTVLGQMAAVWERGAGCSGKV